MWKPNDAGYTELLTIFRESKSNNSKTHYDIYQKINEYSNEKEFTNYLVYILNNIDLEVDTRQIAGLTLKAIMERSFVSINEDSIDYFKTNILKCYTEENPKIRKTISNLINTFIRHAGTEMWPEILCFLYKNLDYDISVEMSLETINIIIDDSGSYLENKQIEFLMNLSQKLINYLKIICERSREEIKDNLIILVLKCIQILLDSCPNHMSNEISKLSDTLYNLHNIENIQIRFYTGRCWLNIIKINQNILLTNFDDLYSFFYSNLTVENYEMNFISAEFFLFLVDEEGHELIKNSHINNTLFNNLKQLLPYILYYMNLSNNDICGLENKFKEIKDEENEETEIEKGDAYNPNWSLRKCCSKFLDKLSYIYPSLILEILKPYLEENMQNKDWEIKERSILALGAIAYGCNDYLQDHLQTLIAFLIKELQHSHKLIRAISLWTLSRYSNFILIDNKSDKSNELLRDYLSETLRRFLDNEVIVQDAAQSAFSAMINTNKQKIEPYLLDIIKIITNAFDNSSGTSLLTLYEIVSLLAESYEDHFKNKSLVNNLIKCIVNKWYSIMNSKESVQICPVYEMTSSVFKISHSIMNEYVDDFIHGATTLIEKNCEGDIDKEVLTKCIDFISVICHTEPNIIKNHSLKNKIFELSLKIINIDNLYVKHYIIALIGDFCKLDPDLLKPKADLLIKILIKNLELFNKYETVEVEKISVCNNTCWSLGLISIHLKEDTVKYVNIIIKHLLKIISLPKLNKSLAQNVSICIGRLGLVDPDSLKDYLDKFIKQFCLSLRNIKESNEKQEAFRGICNVIIRNPDGIINHFPYFCDAICLYENTPNEIESLFQSLISSYKLRLRDKWNEYIKNFPDKLKKKMNSRFL